MLIAFREEVERGLVAAFERLEYPTDDLGIEDPPEGVSAVLASSAAYRLAATVGDPPPQIARRIADEIDPGVFDYVGAVRAQGPYVNFHPSEAYFADTLIAAQKRDYGQLPPRDVDVVVEHTSANPTGPVHVGRARNPIVGDALVRILRFAGYDVDAHYYVNDAGRQVAVFTWAYETFDEEDLPEPERDRIEYDLVRYYRKGNDYLESADATAVEAAENEIQAIMQGLEEGDRAVYDRVSAVVDRVIGGMSECLARLPADFDEFVKETRFIEDDSTAVVADRLIETDLAYEDEGAWHLDLSERGFEKDLVFLRSDGTSLYTTRDLAHHEWKFENYDRAVTVLGEDHKLQAAQLQAALEILGHDSDRLTDVIYSYVNLPEGKMSTRAGTGIDLDDLLDEAIERAREAVESRLDTRIRNDDLDSADVDRIAHQVGIGAVRYDIVAKQPTKPLTFDWDEALDFEGQSAPYVQYAHARTCGIIGEASSMPAGDDIDPSVLDHEMEDRLVGEIARFPAIVEDSAETFEPHAVATYARELADAFNRFYRECPVLSEDVPAELTTARLGLVLASRNTLANALSLLGIEAPDSM